MTQDFDFSLKIASCASFCTLGSAFFNNGSIKEFDPCSQLGDGAAGIAHHVRLRVIQQRA